MSTSHHTPEDVQHAIDHGLITDAYQADKEALITDLNQLRSAELISYLQYKHHAYMAVSLLSPGLKSDFDAHAEQELQHADLLASRVQQLGCVPIFSPEEIAKKSAQLGVHAEQGATLADMVIENLMVERQQVEAYTNLIRQLGDNDPVTQSLLVGILTETEKHASELADYLKRISEVRE
jgi:bacterioferritin